MIRTLGLRASVLLLPLTMLACGGSTSTPPTPPTANPPRLVAPTNLPTTQMGVALSEAISISNSNSATTIAANTCTFVDTGGQAITAADDRGFVIATGTNSCEISGTPDTSGAVVLRVRAANSAGNTSAVLDISLTVSSPPSAPVLVAPTNLPTVRVGVALSEAISISNANSTTTIAASTCTFVDTDGQAITTTNDRGFVIATVGDSCAITGTPDASGAATLRVQAANSAGDTSEILNISLMVGPPVNAPVLVAPTNLPTVRVGVALSEAISIANSNSNSNSAIATNNCSFVDGDGQIITTATFRGFDINTGTNSCEISGTPAAPGDITMRVQARNSAGESSAILEISLTVDPSVSAPVLVAPTNLPTARIGVVLSEAISITNSNSTTTIAANTCTFVDTDGQAITAADDRGFVIDTRTNSCEISGTPDTSGALTLRVQAANSADDTSAILDILLMVDLATPPVLVAPTNLPTVRTGIALSEAISITNSNSVTTIAASTCTFVDGSGQAITGGSRGFIIATVGDTCAITGTPDAPGALTLRVQAANGAGDISSILDISLMVGPPVSAPVLVVPTNLPTTQIGVALSEAISISNSNSATTIAANTCAFVDTGGQAITAADDRGFVIATVGDSCAISGTPDTSGALTLRVQAANSAGDTSAILNISLMVNLATSPVLVVQTNLPTVRMGVALSEAISISNSNSATTIAANTCTFVNTGGQAITAADDRGFIIATGTNTCEISGKPTTSGAIILRVRAANGAGDASEILDISLMVGLPVSAPELVAPTNLPTARMGVVLSEAISITNSNSATTIAANTCTFVNTGGQAISTTNDRGFVITTVANTCEISGTPTTSGTIILRVQATNSAGDISSILNISLMVDPSMPPALVAPTYLPVLTMGIVLSEAISITNSDDLSPITADTCTFVDTDGQAVTTANDRDLVIATVGNTCEISGTPSTAGRLTWRVQANGSGMTSEVVNIVLTVNAALGFPVLVTPSSLPMPTVAEALSETISITNANSLSAIAAGTCTFVDTDGQDVTTAADRGLVIATVDDSCTITGMPDAPGRQVWQIRAQNASGASSQVISIALNILTADGGAISGGRERIPFISDNPPLSKDIFSVGDMVEISFAKNALGGAVGTDGCTVAPALPQGLTVSVDLVGSCQISGVAQRPAAKKTYTVTGINKLGFDIGRNESFGATVSFGVSVAYTSISTGHAHSCAITSGGQLYCWGAADNGRLGLGASVTTDQTSPAIVGNANNWASVSAGSAHSCAINNDGELHCWGEAGSGRLGLGALVTADQPTPQQVGSATNWATVSAGGTHTCAINSSGELHCWGEADSGRLGLGASVTAGQPTPQRVGSASNWATVSAGGAHTCAINSSGELHCWGDVGASVSTDQTTPQQVGSATNWATVSAGDAHTCAINSSGELHCWGEADNGRLGLGASVTTGQPTPQQVGSATNWATVSAGNAHSCATNSRLELYCWGEVDNARLGLGASVVIDQSTPQRVGSATNWDSVAAGGAHSCAANSNDELYCWGAANNGRLGLEDLVDRAIPEQLDLLTAWRSVDAGYANTCAIGNSNGDTEDAYCWGRNAGGELGRPMDMAGESTPLLIPGGASWRQISVGGDMAGAHVCGATVTNEFWCWGSNSVDQLGRTMVGASTAVPGEIDGDLTARSTGIGISVSGEHSCALTSSNQLYCWGRGVFGVLGTGDTSNQPAPTPVAHPLGASAPPWVSFDTGDQHTCAIDQSGDLWCWGNPLNGRLGIPGGASSNQTSPVQVGDGIDWDSVSAGGVHTCAITKTDALYCWGRGMEGQLGTGNEDDQMTPVRVGTASNWSKVSAGFDHTCGLNSLGQILCWGRGDSGQLGLGDAMSRSRPTRVSAAYSWRDISVGDRHSCATDLIGDLYCWGEGMNGRLGTGSTTDVGVPTLIRRR